MNEEPGMDAGEAIVQFLRLAYRERVGSGCRGEMLRLLPGLGTPERVVAVGLATKTYAMLLDSVAQFPCVNQTDSMGCGVEAEARMDADQAVYLTELRGLLRRAVLTRWVPQQHRLAGMQDDIRGIARDFGLRFAFLRGAALAGRFYANPQSRVCEDLDVLVPEEERGRWEELLVASGYRFRESAPVREARRQYMGQTELVRVGDGMVLDLNYRLTGNAGVGPLSQDMGQVWARVESVHGQDARVTCPAQVGTHAGTVHGQDARATGAPQVWARVGSMQGGEYLLSPEDLLVETMRHFGHGHDYTRGFWRMCLDVSVLLRKHPEMDFDYIARQAKACEARVMLDLVGHAYNTLYALPDEGDPIFPRIQSRSGMTGREASAFSRAVIAPHLRYEISPPHGAGRILRGNRKVFGIAWGLDRVRRYWLLVRVLVFPKRYEVLLLTNDAFGTTRQEDVPLLRRYGVFWLQAFAVAPGVILGGVILHALAPLRWCVRNVGRQIPR